MKYLMDRFFLDLYIHFLIKHIEFIDQFCPVGIVHQTTRTEQLQRRYNQKLNARIKYLR